VLLLFQEVIEKLVQVDIAENVFVSSLLRAEALRGREAGTVRF